MYWLCPSSVSIKLSLDKLKVRKFGLAQPPFAVAYAQEQPFDAATIEAIVDEAGISAYFNRGGTINLNQVRGLYRTIESDTDTYLTGLMQVKTDTYSYSEGEDVHVYVSTSGWVLAYYLNSNASAKIFDVVGFTGSTINTKLEIVLSRVATAIKYLAVAIHLLFMIFATQMQLTCRWSAKNKPTSWFISD